MAARCRMGPLRGSCNTSHPAFASWPAWGPRSILALCRDPRRRLRAVRRRSCLPRRGRDHSRWPPTLFTPTEPSMPSAPASSRGNSGPNSFAMPTPVCLRWDLGIGEWDSTNLNVAVYLCNQMIYSPQRRHPRERSSQTVSASRPLRCVAPLMDPADQPGRGLARGNEETLSAHGLPDARCRHGRARREAPDRALQPL